MMSGSVFVMFRRLAMMFCTLFTHAATWGGNKIFETIRMKHSRDNVNEMPLPLLLGMRLGSVCARTRQLSSANWPSSAQIGVAAT